jgi:sigma-B regulation protein RsbU (phosphoserine phosphatase)
LITGNLDHIWPLIDGMPRPITGWLVNTYYFGGCGLGLVALVWNSLRAPTAGARHKIQVMVWGTVLGLSPWMLLQVVALARGDDAFDLPFWAWATAVLSLFLVPLSFAYAVVKHRVLEIPVLLRRSARYLLVQRGFLILIFILGIFATLALAQSFSQHFPSSSRQAIPVGVAFGMVLIGGGTWIQQRVSERVDKAFFRSAYNSKQILEDLVEKTREVRTRTQLSELLESNLRQAMQPSFLVVGLALGPGATEEEDALGVPLDDTFLDELFEHGRPVEITPEMRSAGLDRLGAECMVPVCGRERKKLGLLVLGPRKSEEPYSREDKHLLGLIANQAGSTLENIQLGEEIAEKIEAERRAAHEIDLARQVQRKLFPQNPPLVAGLDYAGDCVQARVVGGDYYDFFELDSGLIAFALADISGKGFPAALLMANLQANLRGQYALAADDLPRLLQSVNRLFYQNTEPSHYATMFFGCYDAQLCRLRYVNCGHNPPLLLRANDCVERFASTATVMGLFPEWDCEVGEAQLHSGDLFVIYTDGVSEAAEPGGEEFGEARLIETLRLHRSLPASALLDRLFSTVQQFSPGEQADDMTAVVAKVK